MKPTFMPLVIILAGTASMARLAVALFAITLAYVLSNLTRGGRKHMARTLALSARRASGR
jgi:hypothetical protein